MPHCIARAFELLLRILRPVPGRHRAAAGPPIVVDRDSPTLPLLRVRADLRVAVLRGEDGALARPNLVALGQRKKEHGQASRRRVLLRALHGFDMAPYVVHGVVMSR